MNKVFVVNKSGHDFAPAEKFGRLVFLSDGPMSRYATNNMFRQFSWKMRKSSPEDYILLCGLSVMNVIACSTFAAKHFRLNLLLFNNGSYLERNLLLETNNEGY